MADIRHGARIVLLHVVERGAPVPGFDVIGPDLDDGVEQLERQLNVLPVDRLLHPRHQEIGGVAAGGEPLRPDAVLDVLGAGGVGRDLQCFEQEVEAAHAVAAHFGQILRRLDRLDPLPRRSGRTGRLHGLRASRQCQKHEADHRRKESRAHGQESRAPLGSRKMAEDQSDVKTGFSPGAP
jgi:hypothetical protein